MSKFKQYAKPISYLLTLLSFFYIAKTIFDSDLDLSHFNNPVITICHILLFGLLASFSILINAYSWKLILEFINGSSLATKDVFQVYLQSNIAKYLPGNIMHYAGRNYLGNRLGWKNHEIALSSILEYILSFGATGIIIIILMMVGLIRIPQQISSQIDLTKITVYVSMGFFASLLAVYAYRYFFCKEKLRNTTIKLWERTQHFFTLVFIKLLIALAVISLLAFIFNCFYYYYLCKIILDFHINPSDFFNANAALSLANYATLLTPGVPAGMGVRESASFLLISAYGYPSGLLMLSLLVFRITCILGDLISFMMVPLFRR